MEKEIEIYTSCHGHVLCQPLSPPEFFFGDFPGFDKGSTSALIDAFKVTGISSIIDGVLGKLGIDGIHFQEFINIYSSNPREVVQLLLDEMDEAKIDRMVVLMLDLATACGEDYQEIPWLQQIDFFSSLYEDTGGRLVPFYGFDPRREHAFEWFKYAIEVKQFKGAKLYTKLGWDPNFLSSKNTDEVNACLYKFYAYCEVNGIPLANHTSGGGIRGELSDDEADEFAEPEKWFDVFFEFPKLKMCFSHFGGNSCFIKTMEKIAKDGFDFTFKKGMNSTEYILCLMAEFEGVWACIAFHDGFHTSRWQNAMRTFFTLPFGPDRLLAGDDWPLHKLKYGLKRFYGKIREALGDNIFKSLLLWNHKEYLGALDEDFKGHRSPLYKYKIRKNKMEKRKK